MSVNVFRLCVVLVCLLNCYANGLTVFGKSRYETTEYGKYTTRSSREDTDHKRKVYTISTEKLPWYQAKFSCLINGLRLASPLNPYENEKLLEYIRQNELIPADKFAGYWIGGVRIGGEEPWLWEASRTQTGDYGWLPGEPNYFPREDCMELKNDEGTLGWNNYYCPEKKRYICEKPVNADLAEDDKGDVPSNQGSHTESIPNMKEDKHMVSKDEHLKNDEMHSASLLAKQNGELLEEDELLSGDEIGTVEKEVEEESSTDPEPEDNTLEDILKDIIELKSYDHYLSTVANNTQSDEENEIAHGLLRK